MIPANQTTLPEMAYSLAIEQAETFARRYHRLAFWVPIWGREFQIKAKMWDYTVERLRNHAQYLGSGVKSKPKHVQPHGYGRAESIVEYVLPKEEAYKITITAGGGIGGSSMGQPSTSIPARPSMADNVGFGE